MTNDSSRSFRPGVSHITSQIRKARLRCWENKNKRTNTGLGQLQVQEKEVGMTLLCSFSCICRLSQARNFYQITGNANSSLTVFSHCLLPLTVLPLDCYLKPTVLLCSTLSSGSLCILWDLPSLLHFRSRGRSRQRDCPSGANTNGKELLRIVSYAVDTLFCANCI